MQDLLWEPELKPAPLLVVLVPALPRDAAVELHVTAVHEDFTKRTSWHVTEKVACGSIECHTIMSADRSSASLSLSLAVPNDNPAVTDVKNVTEAVGSTFNKAIKKMEADLMPLCARVFYKCAHSLAQQIVEGMSLKTLYISFKLIKYLYLLRSFPNKGNMWDTLLLLCPHHHNNENNETACLSALQRKFELTVVK